jgi:hypothetical protein
MIGRRSHDDAQSFEEACNGGAPRNEHIANLIRVAEELCADAAAVQPSTQFRNSLRAQLMTEASSVLVAMPATARPAVTPPAARRPVRRRVAILTAAVVASAGTVGLVSSSASALPGEMLYPVKRTVETVELQLHRDDASRGAFQLTRASERLSEARQLSADGRSTDLIADTLDDFSTAAADGSRNLFSDYAARGAEKSIRQVNDFAAMSSLDLSKLSARLPDSAAASFAAATDAVTDLASEASTLCDSCTPADVRVLASTVEQPKASNPPAADPTKTSPPPADKPTTPVAKTPAPATSPPTSPLKPPATPTTPAVPAVPSPTPRPTEVPPLLSGLTDPLLGGLLGDEEQEGLVPGLVDGLLGGPQ